jgi:hypothetical protein
MVNARGVSLAVLVLSLVAGPALQGQTAPFRQQNTPDNLKALMQRIFEATYVRKSVKEGAALFRSLFPDEARLRPALKDDVTLAAIGRILDFHKKFASASDADLAALAEPQQTTIMVYAATTEELQRYQRGSVAFAKFPGGTQQLANLILRPRLTFYQVEFLEPGKDSGMNYHLFYWDGRQWSMLGPLWRLVK